MATELSREMGAEEDVVTARQIHPLLRPKEEEPGDASSEEAVVETPAPAEEPAPVAELEVPVGETGDSGSAEAGESAPVSIPQQDSTPAPVVESDHFLKVDRRNLYAEIQRLANEDKEFANNFNAAVGRKAAREYKPQLTAKDARIAELEGTLRKMEISSMDEDQVAERLRTDPDFATRYHAKPVDTNVIVQRARYEAMVDEAIATAEEQGVPAAVVQRYQRSLETGWFDYARDAQGNPLQPLAPEQSILAFQRGLMSEAVKLARVNAILPQVAAPAGPVAPAPNPPPASPPPPVAAKPAAMPNPALAKASPDLAPASGGAGGRPRVSLEEWHKMFPPERKALYPNLADFERDLKAGLIQ